MSIRKVIEDDQLQGEKEEIPYKIPMAPWGMNPTNITYTIFDITNDINEDVTAACMTGTATVSPYNEILLPRFKNVIRGRRYRCDVLFNLGDALEGFYFYVLGEP